MPTPVILYIFTFLFIFLWPFGVNILESVCLLLSNLVLYFWDELNISKNVTEIQSTLIHYDNSIYIYCPSRGLLGYPQPRQCHQSQRQPERYLDKVITTWVSQRHISIFSWGRISAFNNCLEYNSRLEHIYLYINHTYLYLFWHRDLD